MAFPPAPLRSLPFVLAILACPHVTYASCDAASEAKATNLFEAGLRAAEAGNCSTALPLFQESLATCRFETLGALFNIAQCESDLGQTGASYLHFREFLREVKGQSSQIAPATDAIAAMTKAGPWLKMMNLDKLPTDATVLLDGVSLGPLQTTTEVPVKMGDHEVVIRIRGKSDRSLSAYVHDREHREVDVSIGGDPPPPPRPLRTVGFIVGGVGLGSLIAGITTGGLAISKNKELYDDYCHKDPGHCYQYHPGEEAAIQQRIEEGKNLTTAANVTFLIGGLLTAVGTTFVFLPPSKSKEVAFSPLVLPGGGGLSVEARF